MMASCTITTETRCAVCVTDDSIDLTEDCDSFSDAYLSVKFDGEGFQIDALRNDDNAWLWASEFQMRALRDWLNKTLKD
jgi:hypothetical protein